ncbi:hypothetical protein [Cysteiniphilum litorale]
MELCYCGGSAKRTYLASTIITLALTASNNMAQAYIIYGLELV